MTEVHDENHAKNEMAYFRRLRVEEPPVIFRKPFRTKSATSIVPRLFLLWFNIVIFFCAPKNALGTSPLY